MRCKIVSAAMIALALIGCGGRDPAPEAADETPVAGASTAEAAPVPTASLSAGRTPVEYVAGGNEPFWSIATYTDRIVYSSPEKLDGETLAASVSDANGWMRFEARMDGAPISLEVRKGQCFDDMSGFEFSHQARLTRADGTWSGCARLASEPQPRE